MQLTTIEPARPGYEQRTFRCVVCGYCESMKVKFEVSSAGLAK